MRFILLSAMMLLAVQPGARSATLLNGDFEAGLSSWTSFGSPGGVTTQAFAAQSGALGLWMPSYHSSHAAGLYQDVAVAAGDVLLFSGSFSREANAVLAVLEMKIEYFTSGNGFISSDVMNHAAAMNAATPGVWTSFAAGGTAPAGAAYARVVAYYDANAPANGENGSAASVFSDNFSLTPEPGRAALLVAGLGSLALRRRRSVC